MLFSFYYLFSIQVLYVVPLSDYICVFVTTNSTLKVLGKIWSIALKYHFRMPPYYTLVLRSLASLEGKFSLAIYFNSFLLMICTFLGR